MADIQFDEDQQRVSAGPNSFFIRLVLKTGLVSSDRQAEYILVGGALALLILAFALPLLFDPSQVQVPQSVIDAAMQQSSAQ